jgi:ankyrin repeat protein
VQYAAIRGHEQICKLLLDHGANPNALGINGMPTLIECIKNEYATDEQIFKCVKILLKYGADVNLLSTGRPIDYSRNAQNEGSTALMEAISWRSRRLCELLLQWGADYEYQNNQKESAITRAQDVEIFEIEDIDHMITLLTNPNIRHGVMIRPDNPILQQGFGNDANNIPRALLKRELGKK